MKVIEFMAAMHEEIQNMIFEQCTPIEKVMVGLTLGALDFKAGQFVAENGQMLTKLGVISEDGDVDLDCAEHALLGLEWPQKVGAFKFDKADAEKIMSAVKERAK